MNFSCRFGNYDSSTDNRNFAQLIRRTNYFGVFGHNIQTCDTNYNRASFCCIGGVGQNSYPLAYTEIVGTPYSMGNGYSIVGIDKWDQSDSLYFEGLRATVWADTDNDAHFAEETSTVNIGTISAGLYMDFPHNTDLNLKINYNYDGVKSKNTISGRTITNVNYHKAPDWGAYPKWTHVPQSTIAGGTHTDDTWLNAMDMKQVNATGRRSWDLTFSYLSKSDTFNKSMEGNMFAHNMEENTAIESADTPRFGLTKNNIVGTMMTLSLGGSIPFLFQPDNTKQEFAFVKLNQKNVSINQVAPELYSVKLKLIECW
jgi:hypothetical protein